MRRKRRKRRSKRRRMKDREGEKRRVCREQEVKDKTSTTNRMSMSMKSRELV